METYFIETAGCVIKVNFLAIEEPFVREKEFIKRIKVYYQGFISSDPQEYNAEVTVTYKDSFKVVQNTKFKEYYVNLYQQITQKKYLTYYHLSDEQFYIVIRSILQVILKKSIMMHGSAININNKAYIFLGESGAGKSTTMKIFSKKYPPLADDSFIIQKNGSKFIFYSTPAVETNAWFNKTHLPLEIGGFFFLRKAQRHQIQKVSNKSQVIQLLFKQFFTNKATLSNQSKIILEISKQLNDFYILDFSLQKEAELIALIEDIHG